MSGFVKTDLANAWPQKESKGLEYALWHATNAMAATPLQTNGQISRTGATSWSPEEGFCRLNRFLADIQPFVLVLIFFPVYLGLRSLAYLDAGSILSLLRPKMYKTHFGFFSTYFLRIGFWPISRAILMLQGSKADHSMQNHTRNLSGSTRADSDDYGRSWLQKTKDS